jgi:hypothetical protein
MRRTITAVLLAASAALAGCGAKSASSAAGTWSVRLQPSKQSYAELPPAARERLESLPADARERGVTDVAVLELRPDGSYLVTVTSAGRSQEGTWTEADGRLTLRPTPGGEALAASTPTSYSRRGDQFVATDLAGNGASLGFEMVLQRK